MEIAALNDFFSEVNSQLGEEKRRGEEQQKEKVSLESSISQLKESLIENKKELAKSNAKEN